MSQFWAWAQWGQRSLKGLLKAQHRTTVWNCSREKAELLAQDGALVASNWRSPSSSLIIACLDSYATTHALLLSDDIKARLPGRTIVQLSTGSPHEARDALAMFTKEGTSHLDGAIMAYPEEIGQPNAMILLSGSEFTYQNHKQTLGALGGDLRYVGESIGGASALDMALLTYDLGAIIGVTQGAALCVVGRCLGRPIRQAVWRAAVTSHGRPRTSACSAVPMKIASLTQARHFQSGEPPSPG